MFITNTVLGGRGFSVPSGEKAYIRTASGYPLTLTKTLAKPPESITVHGNEGGVGDWETTRNIFAAYTQRSEIGVSVTSLSDIELRFTTTRDGTSYVLLYYPVISGMEYTLYGTTTRCSMSLYRNSMSSANLIAQAIDAADGYQYTADFTGDLVLRVYSP